VYVASGGENVLGNSRSFSGPAVRIAIVSGVGRILDDKVPVKLMAIFWREAENASEQ
jgi:hypothetical protein